jgi:hypothetical protein
MAKVSGSSNITFDSVYFHGSLDGDPNNDGGGIDVCQGSKNITIVNSEFEQLYRAATFGGTDGITLIGNKVHDIRSDGFDFTRVSNVLIDSNSFTNFSVITGDHPDAIQFWTKNSTRPSTDIVIRNNQIMQGSGKSMQGIFMADEMGTLPYQRVTIENNLVYTEKHGNGIAVLGGQDVLVQNNTVVSPVDDTVQVAIRLGNVTNGMVTGNITDIVMSGTGVTATRNYLTPVSGLNLSLMTLANIGSVGAPQLLSSLSGYQLVGTGSAVNLAGSTSTTTTTASTSTTTTPTSTTTTTLVEPTTTTTDTTTITSPTTATTDTTSTTTSPTTTTTSPTTTTTTTTDTFTAPTLSDSLDTSGTTTTTTTTTAPAPIKGNSKKKLAAYFQVTDTSTSSTSLSRYASSSYTTQQTLTVSSSST